jgi:hypothetical protein
MCFGTCVNQISIRSCSFEAKEQLSVQTLLSMYEALGLIPSTTRKSKTKKNLLIYLFFLHTIPSLSLFFFMNNPSLVGSGGGDLSGHRISSGMGSNLD